MLVMFVDVIFLYKSAFRNLPTSTVSYLACVFLFSLVTWYKCGMNRIGAISKIWANLGRSKPRRLSVIFVGN